MRTTARILALGLGILAMSITGAALGSGTSARGAFAAASEGPSALAAPHPLPIAVGAPRAGPALYTTHYWAGEYYSGTAARASHLATTVRLPDAAPNGSEFYYVLLSVWDNAGSYDQVGFSNDYGFWGFVYSYTSPCAGTYYYSANHYFLTRGASYTFSMNVSAGNVSFVLKGATGSVLSTVTGHTGGSAFVDQGTYTCKSTTYYDLTDYEEIYSAVQPMPSFDFFFKSNLANGTAITAWSSMGAPPGGGRVTHQKATVEIENEAFWLTFNGTGHVVTLAKNATGFNASLLVHQAFVNGNVTLRAAAPSGWTVSYAPSAGAPGFGDRASIVFGSFLPHTPYFVNLEGVNATGAYSYITLQISIA